MAAATTSARSSTAGASALPSPGRIAAGACTAVLVAALHGCGGNAPTLWPFGGDNPELSRKPANAAEYRCDRGATLFVRTLDQNAVWLIAPDREIRLDRKGEGRYGFGRVEMGFGKDTMELTDPPVTYTNCKRV